MVLLECVWMPTEVSPIARLEPVEGCRSAATCPHYATPLRFSPVEITFWHAGPKLLALNTPSLSIIELDYKNVLAFLSRKHNADPYLRPSRHSSEQPSSGELFSFH